jgi:hypothetical protein
MLTVFEYPAASTALERVRRLEETSRALVRAEGRSVGVIIDPVDRQEAEKLLHGIDREPNGEAVGWDPRSMTDGPLTLGDGIGAMLVGALIGILLAVPRYLVRWHNGIPDGPLRLRI